MITDLVDLAIRYEPRGHRHRLSACTRVRCAVHLAAARISCCRIRYACNVPNPHSAADRHAVEAVRIIDALAVGARGYLDRNAPGLQLAKQSAALTRVMWYRAKCCRFSMRFIPS